MADTVEQRFFAAVPSAKDRVLVDMVNSLDVARDHLGVSRAEEGDILARLFGAISGETQRRNQRIDQAQLHALDALVDTVTELAKSNTKAFSAMEQVATRLTAVELDLAKVARVTVQTREAIRHLRDTVDDTAKRIALDIDRLDLRAAATEQMDNVISRWENGRFNLFPIASRGFIALHELYWGAFGEYQRRQDGSPSATILLDTLKERMASRWRQQIGEEALSLSEWLARPRVVEQVDDFFLDGLAYLGAACSAEKRPWSFTLTQLPEARVAPAEVIRLLDPDRLSDRLTREFFSAA